MLRTSWALDITGVRVRLERWLIGIRTLFPEYLGSSPSTRGSLPSYVILVLRDLTASSGIYRHQARKWCQTHVRAKHPYTENFRNKRWDSPGVRHSDTGGPSASGT